MIRATNGRLSSENKSAKAVIISIKTVSAAHHRTKSPPRTAGNKMKCCTRVSSNRYMEEFLFKLLDNVTVHMITMGDVKNIATLTTTNIVKKHTITTAGIIDRKKINIGNRKKDSVERTN